MPMLPPDDPSAAPWPPAPAPSPFATPPTAARPADPAAVAPQLDDRTVDALLLRLQEAKRRRAAAPSPNPQPSRLASIGWDDLRRKGWSVALTLATAYVATKPERWGWIAPVLTAAAAVSKPPQNGTKKEQP